MRKLKLEELGRKNVSEYKEADKRPVTIVLDNLRSGVNVGSIFRSADAFLFEKIVLCGITPTPPHKEITRTAIGATSSVDWHHEEDIIQAVETLRNDGYVIIIIEQTDGSVPLNSYNFDPKKKYAIVMGNEVNGVNSMLLDKADTCIELQQYGTKHSLNVSVCAGIVFWHANLAFK